MNKWLARSLVALILLAFLYGFYVLGWGVESRITNGNVRWEIKSECLQPRTEVAVTELPGIEGLILVVGGFDQFGRTTATTAVYDPVNDTCSTLPDIPHPIHHPMAATVNRTPYIIGGFTGIPFVPSDRVFRLNVSTDTWEEVARLPAPIGAGAATVLEGKIHVAGGQGPEEDVTSHFVYDPEANTWATSAPLPEARDHLALVSLSGKLYAIAGRLEGNFARNVERVDVYDPTENSWAAGPPLIKERSGHTAAVLADRIYVFGGEEPQGTIGPVEVFDPAQNHWEVVSRLPTPRHGLGAVTVGSQIYVVSGGKRPALSVSATIEAMEIP